MTGQTRRVQNATTCAITRLSIGVERSFARAARTPHRFAGPARIPSDWEALTFESPAGPEATAAVGRVPGRAAPGGRERVGNIVSAMRSRFAAVLWGRAWRPCGYRNAAKFSTASGTAQMQNWAAQYDLPANRAKICPCA